MAGFGESVQLGAAKRVLGIAELGLNAMQAAGISPEMVKQAKMAVALGQQEAQKEGQGTGVTGFVGEMIGDPLTYLGGAGFARNAALGAAGGLTSSTGKEKSNLGDQALMAGVGAAFGLGGEAVSRGAGRVTKGASDLIDPSKKAMMKTLRKNNVPVRLSQVVNSKPLAAIDSVISQVPFSGASSSQEAQRRAFTKAISNKFGEDSEVIDTGVLLSAKNRLSGEYDRILKGVNFAANNLPADIGAAASKIRGAASQEKRQFIDEQAKGVVDLIQAGVLSGPDYQAARQTLKAASKEYAPIKELQTALDSYVRKAGGGVADALGKTDEQYRNFKTAEKVFNQAQNSDGIFKPDTVYNVAKQNISTIGTGGGGEMGALAQAGRMLKQTIPDSGTAIRLAGLGGLGAGGALLTGQDPTAGALAGAAGTVGLSALINKGMTSRYLQEGMSPAIQGVASVINKSGVIPSAGRTAVQQLGETAPQEDDFSDIEALLAQPAEADDFADIEAILQGQTVAPPMSVPMRVDGLNERIKGAESGGDPNAKNPNSSASGLYQFTDGTWNGLAKNYPEQMSGLKKNDPAAQEIAMGLLTQENAKAYESAGIEPNDQDLYFAHFMGAPAAVKAKKLMGQGANAAQVFPAAAKANQSIFFNNGKPRTIDEVYSLIGSKV